MDKYQQIIKLAQAAALIQEVMQVTDSESRDALEDMPDRLADIADAIEEA